MATLITFPDGTIKEVEWEEWPKECFIFCRDAEGTVDCPVDVLSPFDESFDILANISGQVGRIIEGLLKKTITEKTLGKLPERLQELINNTAEGSILLEEKLYIQGDDAAPFREYLYEVAYQSPTFMTCTDAEDTNERPMMASPYRLYWDSNPSEAIKLFLQIISSDLAEAKNLEEG